MTPARPVAASVVALGIASALTAPLPATAHAAALCTQPGKHAAQAGAQLLRINRMEVGSPRAGGSEGASAVPLGGDDAAGPSASAAPADRTKEEAGGKPERSRVIGGVGLADARSVMIADGPVKSAAAARVLDGRVTGTSSRNDLVVQQAPPANRKSSRQRVSAKRFGPLRAGAGMLTSRARWNDGLACGTTTAVAAKSAAQLNRVTAAGGGSQFLVRIPERFASTTSTGVRQRGGKPESVATAALTAGGLSLVDGDVRIRVLRAATLRVSMAAGGKGEVGYEPAIVEVKHRDGERTVLDTVGDYTDITLGEDSTLLESLPGLLEPGEPLPLPTIPGLPVLSEPETTPAPNAANRAKLRILLGGARQANGDRAISARATALKITVTGAGEGRTKSGYGSAADLGLGVLQAAAVAPSAPRSVVEIPDSAGVSNAGAGGLPITGPGTMSLLLTGAGMVAGGIAALLLGARRLRRQA